MNQRTSATTPVLTEHSPIVSQAPASESETGSSASRTLMAYALLSVFIFSIAWLGTLGWKHRSLIADLFYESSLTRYRVASGEAGPATFYVFHNDFSTLERLTQNSDDILGVELSEYSGVAAMAFTSLEAEAVNTVRNHPVVKNMLQKDIPMLCH